MTANAAVAEARTRDAFLGGRVALVQLRKGHRAGLDAGLLQALVPATATGTAVDLGTGVGTVAFSLAARAPALSVIGVERDPDLIACGIEALALPENAALAGRVHLLQADVSDMHAIQEAAGDADWVLMNPPYDREAAGSRSPDPRRREAHVAEEGLLRGWVATAAALLKPGSTLALIHRAEALADVLGALSPQFGGVRVIPVHAAIDAVASRILVTARRGRRSPLTIAPGLVLHEAGGAWTPVADAVLRGAAELAWHD